MASPGNAVYTNSFKSDKARIEYINKFVPVAVPATAEKVTVYAAEWQGFSLDATFVLPESEFSDFERAADIGGGARSRDIPFPIERKKKASKESVGNMCGVKRTAECILPGIKRKCDGW